MKDYQEPEVVAYVSHMNYDTPVLALTGIGLNGLSKGDEFVTLQSHLNVVERYNFFSRRYAEMFESYDIEQEQLRTALQVCVEALARTTEGLKTLRRTSTVTYSGLDKLIEINESAITHAKEIIK